MAFVVNIADLTRILSDIKIAEAHALGTPLTDLINNPLVPFGLRTVDGSFNNLLPGQENWGAADQLMPRLLDPVYRDDADGDTMPIGPGVTITNTDYGTAGNVADADPRLISNLIADQSINNPAAIIAALSSLGSADPFGDAQVFLDALAAARAAEAALPGAQAAVEAAAAALEAAQTENGTANGQASADAASAAAAQDTADGLAADADAAALALANAQFALTDGQTAAGEATQAETDAQDAHAAAMASTGNAIAQLATAQANQSAALAAFGAAAAAAAAAADAAAVEQAAYDALLAEIPDPQTILDQQAVWEAAEQAAIDASEADFEASAVADAASIAAANSLADLNSAIEAESYAQTNLGNAVILAQLAVSNEITEASQLVDAQAAFSAAQGNASAAAEALFIAELDQTAAVTAHAAFQADIDAAQQALDDLIANGADQGDIDLAQDALDDAVAAGADTQTALDSADADLATAQANDDDAQTALNNAQIDLDDAVVENGNAIAAASAANTAVSNAQGALELAQAAVAAAQAIYGADLDAANAAVDAYAQTTADLQTAIDNADAEQTILNNLIASTPSAEVLSAQLDLLTAANDAAASAQAASDAALLIFSAAVQAATAAQQVLTNAQDIEASALSALQAATEASNTADAALPGLTAAVATAQAASDIAQAVAEAAQENADALAQTASESQAVADAAGGTLADALAAVDAATQALGEAEAALVDTQATLDGVPAQIGLEFDVDELSVKIPNVAPDEGLTAPVNGWMTLFGQFFDHGLDLIPKANNGTVYIPLQPDDPLYDHTPGARTNFMVVTRADVDENGDVINLTTPFVDQNQTYTSNASHQVFVREYFMHETAPGEFVPMNTGHLIEGAAGGMATWADVKAQAAEMLGILLTDADVLNVPLLATDEYGNFERGPNGFPMVVMNYLDPETGNFARVEGNPDSPVSLALALRTGHAFLDDIAHMAVPGLVDHDRSPETDPILRTADTDTTIGNAQTPNAFGQNTTYDNELLDLHFIAGDGRANENIGLTAVHHVFHSEHNRLVDAYKETILSSGDLDFINEWLLEQVTELPTDVNSVVWNGERLFQAGRWVTEMEYQHLVFEEFARTIQPNVDAFVFSNTADINPAIFAEFAHVVYRFGHSMLTEEVHRLDGNMVDNDIDLISAFLNPVEFTQLNGGTVTAQEGAAAVVRAMTRVTANELDEFTTEALRNNLVGLPLDLAAINIARARETGVPSLNEARRQFHEMTGDSMLRAYTSWTDFALGIKNPASVVNFIAAYGTHDTILAATNADEKREAAMLLVFGGEGEPEDRIDFLNATGGWANDEKLGGLNEVDFWIGGLAEEIMPFGGMLGSTFNFVFEAQMENLQEGDRFYYLSRAQGMNILNQLEANSFASLIMRNTEMEEGSSHLPGHVFRTPAYTFEVDQSLEVAGQVDPTHDDPYLEALTPMVIRDGNILQYTGGDHVVLGGTGASDTLIGGDGDDTLWGDGGNDRLEGGFGVDMIIGGAGDDIITDAGDIDMLKGGAGNDVIHAGNGLGDLVFGEQGNDFLIGGVDDKEIFAGEGNDFVLGTSGLGFNLGNEGDDWLEGGDSFDTLAGDNSELFFNSQIIGHDVLNGRGNDNDYDGESGDDIMFQGPGVQRNNGMSGFDWTIHKDDPNGADSDLGIPIFVNQEAVILRDRFDLVEGLSGWIHNDNLIGREIVTGANGVGGAAAQFDADDMLESFSNALLQSSVDRIDGFADLVTHLDRVDWTWAGETHRVVVMDEDAVQTDDAGNVSFVLDTAADILLGGGGNDTMTGKAGNDIIDGDRWLNVRIAVQGIPGFDGATADNMTSPVYTDASMTETLFGGRRLDQLMLEGTLNPGDLSIVREILDGDIGNAGVDTAVFRDQLINYSITANEDGSLTVTHLQPLEVDGDDGELEGAGGGNDIFDGSDRLFNIEVLRFSDGNGGTVDFTVAELLNVPPVITSDGGDAAGAVLVAENTVGVTQVVAFDANDDQSLEFSIIGGADEALFDINPATGALIFLAAPNFEAPTGSGSNVYDVIVQVSDGIAVDQQALQVTVQNVDELHTGSVNIINAVGQGNTAQLTAVSTVSDPDGMIGAQMTQWQRLQAGNWVNLVNQTGATLSGVNNGAFRVTSTYTDLFGAKVVVSPETAVVVGSNANNAVVGTAGDDFVLGLVGIDTLTGGAGNDTVIGGNGNDRLMATVGDGDDVYDGGAGIDTYDLSQTSAASNVDLGAGSASSSQTGSDTLVGIENVIGSSGANVITGDVLANTLSGGGGNDTLSGGAGADRLDGNDGDDTLVADVDNVRDVLAGWAGVDTADYSAYSANLTVTLNGTTAATVVGSGGTAARSDTVQGIENFIGGTGNDRLTGDGLANNLHGGVGNDSLFGGGGADVLQGGLGNDSLVGGNGADVLQGGEGNDTLVGGNAADVLTGGQESDVFVYVNVNQSSSANRDLITDFTQGEDLIDLSGIDANTIALIGIGNQAFTSLLGPLGNGNAAAFDNVQQLRYSYDAGNDLTIVEGNANQNAAAEFQIALVGQHALTLADFVL